jgi:two-component system cell cycle response regulator DivK
MSLRILLVEDNPENRDMLSRRLIRRGYQLSFAMDGAEAVRLTQAERPELVLMDLSLPVMDGWEATRRLKSDVATQSIPIIALTAHAMVGDRERAIEAGANDYDTKPVDIERLLGKIMALTARGA